MRKRFFILNVFLLLALSGCSSASYVEVKPIKIEEVLPVPNKTKIEIYSKTRQWFTNYFTLGEFVIDYEDKDSGTIMGKGIFDNGIVESMFILSRVNYKMKVDTKDNKARIAISLLQYDVKIGDNQSEAKSGWITEQNQVTAKATMEKICADLKEYILSKEDSTDW